MSFKSARHQLCKKVETIADGLRAPLSDFTFSIISQYVDDIVTVSENSIIEAMYKFWSHCKMIIEPSSAVPLAALLGGKLIVIISV